MELTNITKILIFLLKSLLKFIKNNIFLIILNYRKNGEILNLKKRKCRSTINFV